MFEFCDYEEIDCPECGYRNEYDIEDLDTGSIICVECDESIALDDDYI